MSHALVALCFPVLLSAPEPRSGRPLSDKCSGLIDCILLLHEEYYIRVGEVFNGKVIALTEETLTIKKWRTVARVFRVSPALASERIPLGQNLGTGHRMGHLRVGDMVGFDLAHARDGYVCTGLGIYRRPGGRIPEAEDGHLPPTSRLHNRCGAEQFVEEVFVPRLLPRLLVRYGR